MFIFGFNYWVFILFVIMCMGTRGRQEGRANGNPPGRAADGGGVHTGSRTRRKGRIGSGSHTPVESRGQAAHRENARIAEKPRAGAHALRGKRTVQAGSAARGAWRSPRFGGRAGWRADRVLRLRCVQKNRDRPRGRREDCPRLRTPQRKVSRAGRSCPNPVSDGQPDIPRTDGIFLLEKIGLHRDHRRIRESGNYCGTDAMAVERETDRRAAGNLTAGIIITTLQDEVVTRFHIS